MTVDRTSAHYRRTTHIIFDWFKVAEIATAGLLYERLEAAGLLFTDDLRIRLADAEAALSRPTGCSCKPKSFWRRFSVNKAV